MKKAAFPSPASLIEGELTVFPDFPPLNLATPSVWNFVVYELCTQSSYHKTEVIFSLFHNAAVSEPSHHEIEVVVPSSDSEALIDIIYDE